MKRFWWLVRGNFNISHHNQKLSILVITSSMTKKARTRFETFSLEFFFKTSRKHPDCELGGGPDFPSPPLPHGFRHYLLQCGLPDLRSWFLRSWFQTKHNIGLSICFEPVFLLLPYPWDCRENSRINTSKVTIVSGSSKPKLAQQEWAVHNLIRG